MTDTATAPTLLDTLRAGLAWLYDTPQPDDAILQHHGVTAPEFDNRRLRFIPTGWNGHVVIVLDVAHWTWLPHGEGIASHTLADGELHRLAALLGSLDHKVAHSWNGTQGLVTGSLALARPAHPTLRAAVARYCAGCPEHGTVFCNEWYRAGHARITQPTWPEETR